MNGRKTRQLSSIGQFYEQIMTWETTSWSGWHFRILQAGSWARWAPTGEEALSSLNLCNRDIDSAFPFSVYNRGGLENSSESTETVPVTITSSMSEFLIFEKQTRKTSFFALVKLFGSWLLVLSAFPETYKLLSLVGVNTVLLHSTIGIM